MLFLCLFYLHQIQHTVIFRYGIYLVAEFSESVEEIENFMSLVHRVMGELPYTSVERARLAGDQGETSALNADAPIEKTAPKLTADGTYIMHTALTASETAKEASKDKAKVCFSSISGFP